MKVPTRIRFVYLRNELRRQKVGEDIKKVMKISLCYGLGVITIHPNLAKMGM